MDRNEEAELVEILDRVIENRITRILEANREKVGLDAYKEEYMHRSCARQYAIEQLETVLTRLLESVPLEAS